MPTINDWLNSPSRTRLAQAQEEAARSRLLQRSAIVAQAATVVGHEGWQTFLNLLQAEIEARERERDAVMRQMAHGPEVGEALTGLKLILARLEGRLAGLALAQGVIPGLLEAEPAKT